MAKAGIKWNEAELAEQEEERLLANRMKIDEPKTPFHRLEEDGEEPMAFPPKAEAAKPGGRLHGDTVMGGGDDLFAKIAAAAQERQETDDGPEEDAEGASRAVEFCAQTSHLSLRALSRLLCSRRQSKGFRGGTQEPLQGGEPRRAAQTGSRDGRRGGRG